MNSCMCRRSLTVLTSLAMVAALVAAGALPALGDHITVDAGGGVTVSEADVATTDTFTITVGAAMTVTVVPQSGRVTVDPASIVFAAAGSTDVTVTAVDDEIDNLTDTVDIDLKVDDAVHGTVTVTIADDDTAGIAVTPTSGLTTSEAGDDDSFSVVLDSEPTADVVVGVSSNDEGEATVDRATLTFTSADWATPKIVTVSGVNDDVDDGNQPFTIVLAAATSTDGNYNGINPTDVAGTNTDDDTAGITVSPTSGLAVTEAGSTDTFTVVLDSEPNGTVVVGVSSSDETEATVDAANLTFNAGNWDSPRTVTVTGVDDAADDGNQPFTIVLGASTSDDANYIGIDPADVTGVNADNDVTPPPPPASETFSDLDGLSQETLDAIDTLVELEITQGTTTTTYSPTDPVTRWQMALFITRQLTVHGVTLPTPTHQGFADLTGLTSETIDAISQIAALEVTTGTSETTYSPNGEVNRWQMALFMTRVLTAAGFDLPTGDGSQFTDIGGLDPATQVAIRQLAELGVVFGTGNEMFSPGETVSRWQMALFIVRTLEAAGDLPA